MLCHQSAPRVGCPGLCLPLSSDQIGRLCRTAEVFAERVVRRLGLSREDWNDLRQDIALQVLRRLRHFDERRAPFGAFVDLVARRAAERLKAKAARRRAWEILVNPQFPDPADPTGDDADDGDGGTTLFHAEDQKRTPEHVRIDRLAGCVLDYAGHGMVTVVQHRLGSNRFSYRAIKTTPRRAA